MVGEYTDPDRLFAYHRPSPENLAKIQTLRDEHRKLGHLIRELVPNCPELTLALRSLHECSKHANYALVQDDPVVPYDRDLPVPASNKGLPAPIPAG